jgi:superfamily II DNA/RNA helicase
MMTNVEEFRSHLLALDQDRGFRSEAAQLQAKALLSEITQDIPSYDWKYVPHRVLRNLVVATFELETIARSSPMSIGDLSSAARRFALIWESLAQLQEGTSRNSALLNAAVNYELAGYQANAMCIARKIERESPGNNGVAINELCRLFLQRKFLKLLQACKPYQREPRKSGISQTDFAEAMSLALASKGFLHAVRFFLGGEDDEIEKALQVFEKARTLFTSLALVEESNLTQAVSSLLPVMKGRSTWALLSDLSEDHFKWRRYLKLLARGAGEDISGGKSVSELWPSQLKALEKGLLTTTANKLVRMPTSAGKTRIAELAIVHTLVDNPGAKCVYVAPYRALASEVKESFFNLLSDLGYRVATVPGSYESDEFEDFLFHHTDVLVCTPEKLDLLLRAQPELLDSVRLVVLDEGHIVHDSHRGVKTELLLTRLKKRLSRARFLILSAVVPLTTLEDFAKWFNASFHDDVLDSTWRPSIQRFAKFEWLSDIGVLRYAPDEEAPVLREFVPGVVRIQKFEFKNPETGRINRKLFPSKTSKAQIAAELAFKFADLGPVLVFCPQSNLVEAVARALNDRIELARLCQQPLPSHFIGGASPKSAAVADEWLQGRPIAGWLKNGIGVHYGDLPDDVREAIEADFRQRKLRVIIATNTLAQGVNLPVKTVIVHSCWRYIGDKKRERILARDFWNIAGRAGRAGEETEGLIIHISMDGKDELDYNYYLDNRAEVEPVESALFQYLSGLTEDRLSEEGLKTDLDPEILAMLVEEGPERFSDQGVTELLEESLVKVQAERRQIPLTRLVRVIVEVASEITKNIPDPELRTAYSSTGLSSTSCEVLRQHVEANEERIGELLLNSNSGNLEEIVDLLVPICLSLQEIRPEIEFNDNPAELLKKWIEGSNFSFLVREFVHYAGSAEELGKFIDDSFKYRLPWGLSGYLRIAQKILGVDRTKTSETMKFFPAMVKFGLPDPISCWVRSVGIPFRRIAIELAERYKDGNSSRDYKSFLEWLGTLSIDSLRYDLGLKSPFLEDIHKAILAAGLNPILRQITDIDSFLPCEVEVQGIQYENRGVIALRAREGAAVSLTRDYDFQIDRNAIAVNLNGQQLGYVPRQVSQVLAPEMDIGARYKAIITRIQRDDLISKILVKIQPD